VNREVASEIDQHAALPNETFAAERKKPRPLKSNVIQILEHEQHRKVENLSSISGQRGPKKKSQVAG
jgi:hypothetical protein